MNLDDADAIDFLEIAAHLGYLGYTVVPPAVGNQWFLAKHKDRWNFGFRRWRSSLFLKCTVGLEESDLGDRGQLLEWLNELQIKARLTSYHTAKNSLGQPYVEAAALLPIEYDRSAFGAWMLTWIEEISRITMPIRRQSESDRCACE